MSSAWFCSCSLYLIGAHDVGRFYRHAWTLLRVRHADLVDGLPQSPTDSDAYLLRFVTRRLTSGFEEVRGRCGERPRFLQQHPSCVGQRDTLTVAQEQRDVQFLFQLTDESAQRRLGDVETLGSAGDARFLGDRDESAQVSEIHGVRFYTRSVCLGSERCI